MLQKQAVKNFVTQLEMALVFNFSHILCAYIILMSALDCDSFVASKWSKSVVKRVPNYDLSIKYDCLTLHMLSNHTSQGRTIKLRVIFSIAREKHHMAVLQVTLNTLPIIFGLNKYSAFDADNFSELGKI